MMLLSEFSAVQIWCYRSSSGVSPPNPTLLHTWGGHCNGCLSVLHLHSLLPSQPTSPHPDLVTISRFWILDRQLLHFTVDSTIRRHSFHWRILSTTATERGFRYRRYFMRV